MSVRKFTKSKVPLKYLLSFDKFRKTLPSKQRVTFELLCYEGLTPAEIARQTGRCRSAITKDISTIQQKMNLLATAEAKRLFNHILEKKGLRTKRKWHNKTVSNKQTKFVTTQQAREILKKPQ